METAKLRMHAPRNVMEDLEKFKLAWAFASAIMLRVSKIFAMTLVERSPRRFLSPLTAKYKFTILLLSLHKS
jgi:hypothetical protein